MGENGAQAFLHGFILAIGLILPLGVQNLFVFTQGALQPKLFDAFPVVIAAAVCDTLLILLSVQGVSLLLMNFGFFKMILIGSGVVFLCYMGWLTWHNTSEQGSDEDAKTFSLKQQIVFAVTVSLLNPHAVLDTVGVIGTSSVSYAGADKLFFTAACIAVSWIWFFSLAALGRTMGSRDWYSRSFAAINRVSAVFMWGSASYMLYSAV
ncbi:MAG: Lysine exporter protein [Firmicutes bacterium]|nr:Lysine exporter protein [Bacillota bacterium]